MSHKLIWSIVAIIVILGAAFYFLRPDSVSAPATTETPTATSSPTVTETPNATPTSASYTLAEVATHNIPTNCWTVISGKVYNVTSWIAEHPGGSQGIIRLCGIDGTAAFTGQHGGQPRPASELAGFEIGTLAQ